MNAFFAEFFGTAIIIVFGGGVVANVLLNKTKGNNSGWIVITFRMGSRSFYRGIDCSTIQRCPFESCCHSCSCTGT